MLSRTVREAGISLIEVMIGLVIIGILLMLALPSMGTWLQNTQIRSAGESLLAGLNLARNEAVKRNAVVRFQLVSSLASDCALSTSGTNWVVSRADPTGACEVTPSETTAPQIIQKASMVEGSPNVSIAATGASTVYFNGVGRVTSPSGAANATQIDITNASGGACQHATTPGPMRCMRLTISSGGQVKMCDPKVTDTTDPRKC